MSSPLERFLEQQARAYGAFRAALTAESDRGCALFAAAYLDRALSDLLYVSLVDNKKIDDELLGSNGPLHTFSARIKLAYYLGKLSPAERTDFETVRTIRNTFAHHPEYVDFEVQSIRDRCSNLRHTWHEADARPRAKFTAAVAGLLARVHRETLSAVAPKEKTDDLPSTADKHRIASEANNSLNALLRLQTRDTDENDA